MFSLCILLPVLHATRPLCQLLAVNLAVLIAKHQLDRIEIDNHTIELVTVSFIFRPECSTRS